VTGAADPVAPGRLANWAGNHVYRARGVAAPGSVEELQELVRRSRRLRPLGTRHSFNDLADTNGTLVSLGGLPRRIEIDARASTVTVDGGAAYGDLCGPLHEAGFALHNLASLPHISVAGACATATHGSGDRNGSLATSVVGLELVRADGELERIDASTGRPLDGAVVALGALGIVVSMTLAIQPTFVVRQDVRLDVPFGAAARMLDDVLGAASAVSLFTDWSRPVFHQVWLKRRADDDAPVPRVLRTARPAAEDLHPIPGLPAEACTPQRGVPGPWHERLPHFRLDHRPSAGAELQSEYLLPRGEAPAALAALARLAPLLAPLTFVTEVRSIAADGHWLSPAFGRESVAIHFTWRPDWRPVRAALGAVERGLEPFEPRPHWGKLFTVDPAAVRDRYPKRAAFVDLARRLDPEGAFRNDFLDRFVFGD